MKKFAKKMMVFLMAAAAMFSVGASASALNMDSFQDSFNKAQNKINATASVVSVMIPLVMTFIGGVFLLIIVSIRRSRKLDAAMQRLSANPSQAAAENAIAVFRETSGIVRGNLSLGGDSRGTHFRMWRSVFNCDANPSPQILPQTKEALRQELIRFSAHGLDPVRRVQTYEEAQAAAKDFGQGGEMQVWHNLKSLQGCDVYRNVKLRNGNTSSQIDAVIVDAQKGVFLLEVKSAGGVKTADGSKRIAYESLKEDPSNQIYRHEYDFKTCFGDLDLAGKIKNVLVFSWPNGEERRWVDKSSFPQVDYDILTVEQLMGYHRAQPAAVLTEQERMRLSQYLRTCCGECVVR